MSLSRYGHLFANIRNWETYFAHKHYLMKVPGEDVSYVTRRGFRLEVPRHRFPEFKEVFVQQVYWPKPWQSISLEKIHTVIDVGANIGFFTLFAAQAFPQARIVAVEPIYENHQRLARLLHENALERARAIHAALAGHGDGITLRFDSTEAFTTAATVFQQSSFRADWAPAVVREERVASMTLGHLLDQEGMVSCDLLKMDCEGSEYEVLYKAEPEVLTRIKRVAIETHPGPEPEQQPAALETFLQGNGFKTWTREAMLYGQRH
ncbi:MAG: hypothetical protein OHK005_11740 [Candidatus Methylacidiphilales bacterium]